MPRGGRRPGAGRKPKSAIEKAITGNPSHSATVLQHPSSTAVAAVDVFEPSAALPAPAREVWKELAPHAFAARTLTRATAAAFDMLCRNIVLERTLALSALGAAGADHRGMIQRVNGALKDFGLSPFGKALYSPAVEPTKAVELTPLKRLLNRSRG